MRAQRIKLAVAAALAATAVAAQVATAEPAPWGAGCMPTPEGAVRTSANCGASLANGQAIAPVGAPVEVKRAIAAADQIDGRPYVWGGGHVSFLSRGYDCSGAVGYVLHAAGLLDQTMVSGQLAYWGESGLGRWITVYANDEHVFMVIAGLRFDTRDDPPGINGPRWHRAKVDPRHFAARHPVGL
jgi:cell wall-associated NlpC family hydrolase